MRLAFSVLFVGGCFGQPDEAPSETGADPAPTGTNEECPDGLWVAFEATDLQTGEPQFECTYADESGQGGLTDAAGRGALCAPAGPFVDLRVTCGSAGDTYERVDPAAMGLLNGAGLPLPIRPIHSATAADLSQAGVVLPVAGAMLVTVQVLSLPTGEPLLGATVQIHGGHGDTFSLQDDGSVVAGAEVAEGGMVFVTEVPMAAVPAFSVEPPAAFAGDCLGPATPSDSKTGGEVFGITFVCE